ncbi:hypothetical protein FFT09_22605 [Saccharomonospora piscinae]|uniref:hypothetical protein n=1 Tax=Saccharomonospora piscinae TaxID=687388 RepID=UPI001105DCD1|nr:hypothetical protein [Saccharomonospora piscinae]TLW89225.1 hypothetical protein FFT09_22605 [Saccharomonospora piscinae]
MFVDETKRPNLLLTAAALPPQQVASARRVLRGLVLPGQRRLHLVKESPARRKQILDAITELDPTVAVYDAAQHPRRRQREACLQALVTDLSATNAARVILELDEVVRDIDRNVLYRRVRETGATDLRYEHLRAHEEPLLAIPDAIAWCWSRGGAWQARVHELVDTIRTV